MIFVNPIYYVEKLHSLIERGEIVSEQDIRRAGEYLGTPFKRVEVFLERYREVFTRFIEKRCSEVPEGHRVCIYSWNRKRAFKSFPVSNYATGTIILFRDNEPIEVLSTPLPKALDYFEESEETPREAVPRFVSARVDGWQVNAYFDKLLGRWMFSTRYVLHNMYFSMGRLVVGSYGEILNPIVATADMIAEEKDLYKSLDRFRGWVFIFSLEGPEPAIISPPYPVAPDTEKYRLYLLAGRDPSGKLYTSEEVKELIKWDLVPRIIQPKKLSDLYNEIRDSLDTRSYIAWVYRDSEDPLLIEISSRYYYEAAMTKYMYDAKSAAILCCEDQCENMKNRLTSDRVKQSIDEINALVRDLISYFEKRSSEDPEKIALALSDLVRREIGREAISSREIATELKSRSFKRLTKKLLSILFENKSLLSEDLGRVISELRMFVRE